MAQLVAVRLPPGEAFLDAWDRTWSAGDAILPLPTDAPDAVVADIVDRLQPHALVVSPAGQPDRTRVIRLEAGREVADGTGLVVSTSGSTGRPKGVVLSRAAIDAAVVSSLHRLDGRDGAAWLSCLPWHHTAGLLTVLRSRAAGVEPVVQDRFDVTLVAEALRRVAFVSLVPTQLGRLLAADVDLSALDAVLLGGAAASDRLLAQAGDRSIRVVTSYGMTETSGGCVYDGVPLAGVTVGVDDGGVIHVAGRPLLDGYRGGRSGRLTPLAPLTTLNEHGDVGLATDPGPGWFASSDRGEIRAGRLVVQGRLDDIIITGGENVSAVAVADCLRSHPDVHDAAVVAVDDADWGQAVAALVVAEATDMVALREHVAAALGRASAPRHVLVVDEIPRTALGKADRRAIVRRLQGS